MCNVGIQHAAVLVPGINKFHYGNKENTYSHDIIFSVSGMMMPMFLCSNAFQSFRELFPMPVCCVMMLFTCSVLMRTFWSNKKMKEFSGYY